MKDKYKFLEEIFKNSLYEERYEIEGRNIAKADYSDMKKILRTIYKLERELPGEPYRDMFIKDFYLGKNFRLRDIRVYGNENRHLFLEKKYFDEITRGKYGIRVLKEEKINNEIDDEMEEYILSLIIPKKLIAGERKEKIDEFKGQKIKTCIDLIFRPEVIGVEYEIVNGKEDIQRSVEILEEYYEKRIKRILDKIRNENDVDFREEYKTYPELLSEKR